MKYEDEKPLIIKGEEKDKFEEQFDLTFIASKYDQQLYIARAPQLSESCWGAYAATDIGVVVSIKV